MANIKGTQFIYGPIGLPAKGGNARDWAIKDKRSYI
jgi:hypothetical protein